MRPHGEVAAEVETRLNQWKAEQKEDGDNPRPTKADFSDFLKRFKALVKEQSAPEDIPFAVPWDKIKKKVPKYVKDLRGKLNVPRERFWTSDEGLCKNSPILRIALASRGASATGERQTVACEAFLRSLTLPGAAAASAYVAGYSPRPTLCDTHQRRVLSNHFISREKKRCQVREK